MAFIVGIDLGTSTTIVSIMNEGVPELRPDPDKADSPVTPSVVLVQEDGPAIVGHFALSQRNLFPEKVVVEAKRWIGTDKGFPESAPDDVQQPAYKILAEILYKRLEKLIPLAVSHGEREIRVMISVPAYYGDRERKLTREAWEIASDRVKAAHGEFNFFLEGLVDEPLAAAICQCYETTDLFKGQPLLVFDLGGGTFDITIYSAELLEARACLSVHVFAKDGEQRLGGADWDRVLADMWAEKAKVAVDALPPGERFELLEECRNTREALGQLSKSRVKSPHGNTVITLDVQRTDFEQRCEPLLDRLDDCLDRVVDFVRQKHGLDAGAYTVLLVGGGTQMPMVKRKVQDRFGANRVVPHHSPQEAVARGACLYGAVRNGVDITRRALRNIKDIEVRDIVTRSYGVLGTRQGQYGLKVVIPRNSLCNESEYVYRDLAVKEDGKQAVQLPIGAVSNTAEKDDFLLLEPDDSNVTVETFELQIPNGHTTVAGQPIHVYLRPKVNGMIEGRASLRDPRDPTKGICDVPIRIVER